MVWTGCWETCSDTRSYSRPPLRWEALPGQKARWPSRASRAGVSVSPASRITTIPIASAGPVVLNRPISAKDMATNPTITVPALLVIVSPTR